MKRPSVLLVLPVLLVACSRSTSPASTTSTADERTTTTSVPGSVEITVTVGTDSGANRVENVSIGSEVILRITNPLADDEFHLHGYDLSTGDTAKGKTASISFTAATAGEFEVESHVTEDVLLVIVVK